MGSQLQAYINQAFHLAVWLAILVAVFVPLERLFTLNGRGAKREGLGRDIGYYFLNSLLPTAILAIVGGLLAASLGRLMPAPAAVWVAALPLWARSVAVFVVGEVGFYWGHRWSHASPVLWRFHAIHHSAEHLDWLANTRAHPIDMIFGRLCGLVPIYALGLAQPTGDAKALIPLLILFFATFWGFFIHANVRWRFGPLEWLIATPAFHHWHHTNDANRDRNFASTLPWIDRLFGTHHLPREWPSEYGIDDKTMPKGVTGQLLHPLQR